MRAEKQLLLDQIKEEIKSSSFLMLFKYQKLDANAVADFRDEIAKAGGSLTVIGKRVLIKAGEELGYKFTREELPGHIAYVTAKEHPVSTTKAVYDFKKGKEEKIEVIGGHFEGQNCTEADFMAVAKLPTKDEMRAQIVGLFEAPMAQTVSVMNALLSCVLHCVENKCQKET